MRPSTEASSQAEGVVREALVVVTPSSVSIVPSKPQRLPVAASKARTNQATVVFPLVPVTASTSRAEHGSP
jgi:hypothetical protein